MAPMDLGLKGRRALVTAASKGIGRACAEALMAEGSSVFIASRDAKAIQAAAEEIGATGSSARDLSHPGDPEALVAEAIDRLGGLDILVVNTGGPPPGLFESISLAVWDDAYQVVLMSAVRLVKAAVPHIRRSEAGRIVFITSVAVRQPIQRLVLSSSMRAAVTGLAKTLSDELAADRVTVNCLAPDAIRTAAPLAMSASAQARPMPDAVPVTSATSPVSSAGAPARRSLACSSSQYSTSNRSAACSAR